MKFLKYLTQKNRHVYYILLSIIVFLATSLVAQVFWKFFIIPSVFCFAFYLRTLDDVADFKQDKKHILNLGELIVLANIFGVAFFFVNFIGTDPILACTGMIVVVYAMLMQKFRFLKYFCGVIISLFYILLCVGWPLNFTPAIIIYLVVVFIAGIIFERIKNAKKSR